MVHIPRNPACEKEKEIIDTRLLADGDYSIFPVTGQKFSRYFDVYL